MNVLFSGKEYSFAVLEIEWETEIPCNASWTGMVMELNKWECESKKKVASFDMSRALSQCVPSVQIQHIRNTQSRNGLQTQPTNFNLCSI